MECLVAETAIRDAILISEGLFVLVIILIAIAIKACEFVVKKLNLSPPYCDADPLSNPYFAWDKDGNGRIHGVIVRRAR